MKKIYLYALVAITFLGIAGCDIELPYTDVKRSVVIDITRVVGTDGLLAEDGLGNYQVRLMIPWQQGDFSIMSHAQILAVLTDVTGSTSSRTVMDYITDFRRVGDTYNYATTVTLDILDIYNRFGKTNPTAGEILNITVNVVLNDGSVIPGWIPTGGVGRFANEHLVGWQVDNPARTGVSSRVRYMVVCSFDPTIFTGTFDVVAGGQTYTVELTQTSVMPTPMPSGVNPANVFGIEISRMWSGAAAVGFLPSAIVWINTEDFSPIVTLQNGTGTYHDGIEIVWRFNSMTVDTCTREIRFNANRHVPGVGNFGAFDFVLTPQ